MKKYVNQKTIFVFLSLFVFLGAVLIILWQKYSENMNIENNKKVIVQEAKAHFNSILNARIWHATYEGLYAIGEGLKPNPYLYENTYELPEGKRMIKINHAWMTREIAEITNQQEGIKLNITSLNPLNPYNVPNQFEQEGLHYFEKNPNEKFYYKFGDKEDKENFNFIGRLKVEQNCLQCHAIQGYQLGDIRGGIRVSIPLKQYNQNIDVIKKQTNIAIFLIATVGVFIIILFVIISKLLFKKEEALQADNKVLNLELEEYAKELELLNKTLEYKVRDAIEANNQKEKLMISQSRQAAMGEMIGMIGHQWRQPLSSISMNASNLILDLELGDVPKEKIMKEQEEIVTLSQELSKTIEKFQNIFHPDEAKKIENIVDVLEKCLYLTKDECTSLDIEVHLDIDKNIRYPVDSQKLLQVYLGLMKNAIEAVSSNEGIKKIKVGLYRLNNHVVTLFADNGPGINSQMKDKIFEPYFSTKKDKNGTGLGLFMTKTIVEKQLHGKIDIKNSHKGFEIFIFLS